MIDDYEMISELPEWKPAVGAFLANEFLPGTVIDHAWFYAAFGLIEPQHTGSYAEGEKASLRFLKLFEAFRKHMLEEHMIALRSVRGVGYDIVPPVERAPWAEGEAESNVGKELRKAHRRLSFTPLEELTDEQRKRHTDAMVRVGMMRVAMKPKRALPRPDADEHRR